MYYLSKDRGVRGAAVPAGDADGEAEGGLRRRRSF